MGAKAAKPHILVVEDEAHLAVGIKFNLEREGYRVTLVGDGNSALETLERDESIDLVILDLMLPRLSGYAVCQKLRESGRDIPVLILTARTLTEDRIRGFDVGANQYLTKPFDLEELLSRVRNLTQLSQRLKAARGDQHQQLKEFTFDDNVVNFQTHRVTVRGQPARLTTLEMKLLEYFVRNAGRVISRAELLENVWNASPNITTRAVDQFVMRLRKIFEPDPANPRYFVTVRDAGYLFQCAGDSAAPQEAE
ncbi:MAG: DNA-binding response regulator [Pirellulaceae bacterium]|nr:MAG: DNA-binding response regulator [Pirellulaceae bacterium]